jgi:hypothetical protein
MKAPVTPGELSLTAMRVNEMRLDNREKQKDRAAGGLIESLFGEDHYHGPCQKPKRKPKPGPPTVTPGPPS